MDLRIIIVSWNNRDTLPRLLSSLEKACEGLLWDAVVVDNASTDGTREWLKSVVGSRESVVCVLNNENRGFARACNQGLAGGDARYVLLLNPDCECPEGSLARFVHEADKHPEAGILGPKLVNEDGSVQTSLRRYPQWMDQMGILFKLHNFFPDLPFFRHYFAKDRDLNVEQSVEQVMGACFLIRREVIERLGGLDERYFAWFEEVDYCKMTKEAGLEIRYLPSVEVRHIGGHSFAQASSVKKQRIFNASLISYFRKWHPGWRAESLALISSVSIGLAWLAGKLGLAGKGSRKVLKTTDDRRQTTENAFDLRTYGPTDLRTWFLLILSIELISGLTIFNNAWNTIATIIASLAMVIVAYKKPELGLAVLFLELVIGSKGALLQLGGWPGTSLRVCLFASFFIGWTIALLNDKESRLSRMKDLAVIFKKRWEWIGLAVILVYAALRGLALHQSFFLQDANAWMFLALIVPVFDIASRNGSELKRLASIALMAGIIWIGFKTLALEYFFGHAFHISPEVYLWVRRTGVGEVTLVTANAFRLFFQSHVYEMVGLIGAVSYLFSCFQKSEIKKIQTPVFDVLLASIIALAVSLSRSIWMGTAAGLFVLAIAYNKELIKGWKAMLAIAGTGIVALVLIFGALAFPIPKVDYANLKDVFGSRASTSDAASMSRWNLLKVIKTKIQEAPILGSGFGASITYDSKDPRVLKDHPDGKYTTYAFEWGWFEHWVKFGLFGFLFMIFLVFRIGLRAWRSNNEDWLRYSMVATLVGLSVVHIFTPYLNHPLGFGILLAIEGMSLVYGRQYAATK